MTRVAIYTRVSTDRRSKIRSGSFARSLSAAQLRAGKGILNVAREIGVGTGTVQRIAQEMPRPFDAAA
jgi:hypothetical protein